MAQTYTCQVCGKIEQKDVVAALEAFGYDFWVIHRIECKGGLVQVLTCPDCASLTQDLILESHKERIRLGLVEGIH